MNCESDASETMQGTNKQNTRKFLTKEKYTHMYGNGSNCETKIGLQQGRKESSKKVSYLFNLECDYNKYLRQLIQRSIYLCQDKEKAK
jgi:hypothetical protein